MKFHWTVLSLLFVLLYSCSGKKGSTNTSFGIKIGANTLSALSDHAAGGGMLYGTSGDGQSFGVKIIPGTDLILDLDNGQWKFYGILWDGDQSNTHLSGTTRCSYSSASLEGKEIEIDLNFNNSNCNNPRFSQNVTDEGSGTEQFFSKLKFSSCREDVSGKTDPTTGCFGTSSGAFSSYQVIMAPFKDLSSERFYAVDHGYKSDCFRFDSQTSAFTTFTNKEARIPLGFIGVDSPYRTIVRAFYGNSTCNENGAKGFKDYFFDNGLANHAAGVKKLYNNTNLSLSIFTHVDHATICSGPRLSPTQVAYGSSYRPTIGICTPQQFNLIGGTDLMGRNVEILRNLNFKETLNAIHPGSISCAGPGASLIPIGGYALNDKKGPRVDMTGCSGRSLTQGHSDIDSSYASSPTAYTGTLFGNNYEFNLVMVEAEEFQKVGIVRFLGPNGVIQDLKINKPEVRGQYKVGIVAGEAGSDSIIKNVHIFDGNVEGEKNANDQSSTGGIAGYSSGSIELVTFKEGEVSAHGNYVGGIIGTLVSNSPLTKAYFNGIVRNEKRSGVSSNYTGGVVGNCHGPLNEVASEGLIQSEGTGVGGIAGIVGSTCPVSDAYSSSSIVSTYHDSSVDLGGVFGFRATTNPPDISNAFFSGSITSKCLSGTSCKVGAIGGGGDISSGTKSNLFSYNQALGLGGDIGTNSINAESDLLNNSSAPFTLFSSTKWRQVQGAAPRLRFEEPHFCEKPESILSVQNQISSLGKGVLSTNPITICNREQLLSMETYSSLHFSLKNHVNFRAGTSHQGTTSNALTSSIAFSGSLVGNGNILHNFDTTGPYMMREVGNSSKLEDVIFSNMKINSSSTSSALIQINNGLLSKIELVGASFKGVSDTGSLVSENNGVVSKVLVESAEVYGKDKTGGVVAVNKSNGKVEYVEAYPFVSDIAPTTNIMSVGGIVAENYGQILKSEFGGRVSILKSDLAQNVGGVAGLNTSLIQDVLVKDHAHFEVSQTNSFGGITGNNQGTNAKIERAIMNGHIYAKGTCSNPSYYDQNSCQTSGGTWTLPSLSRFGSAVGIESAGYSLQDKVFYSTLPFTHVAEINYSSGFTLSSDNGSSCHYTGNVGASFPSPFSSMVSIRNKDHHRSDHLFYDVEEGAMGLFEIFQDLCFDTTFHDMTVYDVGFRFNQVGGSLGTWSNLGTSPDFAPSGLKFGDYYSIAFNGSGVYVSNGPQGVDVEVGDILIYNGVQWIIGPREFVERSIVEKFGSFLKDSEMTSLSFFSGKNFDIVIDSPDTIDQRLLDSYIAIIEGGTPSDPPVWRMEESRSPRLFIEW